MRSFFGWAVLSLTGIAAVPVTASDPPLAGFSADAARVQREWERKFKAIPDPARLRESMRRLSARPHHVGSPYDKDNAEWLLAQFRSYGWDARIERFEVLFPTPKERVLELVAPARYAARLDEPVLSADPTSGQKTEQLPTYNAYSVDGDVTAPLVYVNYGIPADYEQLARHGVSVKGAIVIARYGRSWRGIKPKVAAEHGAVGCLIYSDPQDDGYAVGEVFPAGPMRPEQGVQRGSVADMPVYAGDPATPGVGAVAGAKRLARRDITTLTKIPVLPISYGDAQPLLAALGGHTVPEGWRGALPITYRFGPGPAKVHLKVAFNWDTKPVFDVIARIPGRESPDEWVVRGNHHDAWVNGAEDPTSGQVALLEEARAMGELLKQGWRPRRTIVYAAWDGEEPGLLGSTEWAETHAAELQRHAVAYLNTDTNDRGYLDMGGSHVLEKFINDVARDIEDPETKIPVWKRAQALQIRTGSADDRKEARSRADLRIGALGSGSDFTPFLQHLGIAALNLGYGGEDDGGIYHSVYDDFYWYTHFSDTSFVYGRTLAQTIGTAVMRLADAQLIPYDFANLAETVQKYAGELETLAKNKSEEITEQNAQIAEGSFTATSDPRRPTRAPAPKLAPQHFNFAPLHNGADSLTRAATRYKAAVDKLSADGGTRLGRPDVARVNALLVQSERKFLSPAGLPGRGWFRHLLYAPGFYTGYGVKTVPAVREAIEQEHWATVDRETTRVGDVLFAEAALVSQAAAMLERAAR